jgi:hypothetical protein
MVLAAPQQSDINFAADFLALNTLIEACSNGEKVALLLSTCRNAYLTINAIFVDLQILLGGEGQSLRGAAELLMRGDAKRAGELLGRASRTLHEMETKIDVWSSRVEIKDQIETFLSSIAQSDPLTADRIRLMLENVRSPSGEVLGGWDNETLAFDLSHRGHLDGYFAGVQRAGNILGQCIALGRLVATNSIGQPQGSLELFDGTEGADGQDLRVDDAAIRLAQCCDWGVERDGDEIVVEPFGTRGRGAPPKAREIRLPSRLSAENVENVRTGVGTIIRDAMYFCHDHLSDLFRPNVAQRPMSDPFVIQLPPETRTLAQSDPWELKVQRVRCVSRNSPRDHVRIAIANLAVPEKEFDEYRIKEETAAKVALDVRLAIKEAAKQKCQAIVFPEYSVPKALCNELMEAATEHRIVIVGGLEGDWKTAKLVDRAFVAIPSESRLYYQLKQEPSLDEEAGTAFYRDGNVSIFSGSPIGDFAVTLCSDWLEAATIKIWTPDQLMPEVHIIIARNGYVDLYRSFAIADSMRLYAAVVVANVRENKGVSSNEGSCVVVPHRTRPELEAKHVAVNGTYCASLSVFDLDMRAIRARSRGKPESGYFAVPKSAQRTSGNER